MQPKNDYLKCLDLPQTNFTELKELLERDEQYWTLKVQNFKKDSSKFIEKINQLQLK